MPITFIGDVHGWSDRLDRLLAKSVDPLVFMGDLVDRGPDAPGVMDRVRALCVSGRARCLLGNHEYALIRGLGCPERGIACDLQLYRSWCVHFGGWAVLEAFAVPDGDPERLRRALGDRLQWLATLPWMLEDETDGHPWVAVHAGLDGRPWVEQRRLLHRGWEIDDGWPVWLFDKEGILDVPPDFPTDTCLVSGHSPRFAPLITPRRVLCDTSGGRPGWPLTGIIWPEGRAVTD
jgi:hypothetical protein